MSDVNLKTITGTLSWYKILPLNGFNPTCAKQNLHMRRKGVYESFASRRKSRKSLTLPFLWNLANPVKTHHGIFELQHLIDPRRMASRTEPSDESRKVRQQCCYSRDLMESGGQILWNAIVICEMSKTLWQMGKHRTKDDVENHSQGQ